MKKILFIEDEPTLQKTLASLLEKEGFKVFVASDGLRGLEIALNELPDLILLDLILPKLDGFKVLKQLKENEQTKLIPVIVLTNLEGMTDVEKALELGATNYLVKSDYSLEEVLAKIKKIIGE